MGNRLQRAVRLFMQADAYRSAVSWAKVLVPSAVSLVLGAGAWLAGRPWYVAVMFVLFGFAIALVIVTVGLGAIDRWRAMEERKRAALRPDVGFTPYVGEYGVVLGVKNLGAVDEFHAQIVAWSQGAVDTPNQIAPVTLRWVKNTDASLRIPPGITEYLAIGRIAHHAGNGVDNEKGEPSTGIVSVDADWVGSSPSVGWYSYWSAGDFEARLWSLAIMVAAVGKPAQRIQGVRLHLFGRPEDDPTGKLLEIGWRPVRPTLRVTLFDLKSDT